MKKKIVILAIILCSLFILGVVKDLAIKSIVTVVVSQVAGAPVHIDSLSLGITNQSVKITGFKMYNPEGFSKNVLANLPLIKVSINIGALLKGKIHIKSAEVILDEIGLEKNKDGALNVDELKIVKEAKVKQEKPVKQMPILIDVLKLKMGKVVARDYSVQKEPAVTVYNINLDKAYKNITSVQALVALLFAEPLKAAGIQGAAVYGVAALSGVAILPVAVVATFIGKDSVEEEFSANPDKVYNASIAVLKQKGKITKEDKDLRMISGVLNSAQIVVKIRKNANNKTGLVISARKFFLPKQEIAAGLLYEISQYLGK